MKLDEFVTFALTDSPMASHPLLSVVPEKRIPLLKTDEERYVLCVVLEPETVDAQDDIYSAAEVRDAAHGFMEQYQNIGLMHRGLGQRAREDPGVVPRADLVLAGWIPGAKGTWLLAVRILDDDLWGQIKSGELTGLSIGGSARRNPESDVMPNGPSK